jgi:uncharacterized membrane protein YeaQ/YmgE (transglycosylase-associated protein family)
MTMWPRSTAAAGRSTVSPTREYRAMVTFAISAGLLAFALLITPTQTGTVLAALLGVAVSLVEARGLSQRRDWARYAMTPLLWIYVGAGILLFVVALARSGVNIPIGGILAAWALYAKPSEELGPMPTSSTEGTYLIIGAIVAALMQFL